MRSHSHHDLIGADWICIFDEFAIITPSSSKIQNTLAYQAAIIHDIFSMAERRFQTEVCLLQFRTQQTQKTVHYLLQ